MTTLAIVLAAALAILCVLAVARPFLRDPEPAEDTLAEPTGPERERARLAEERDRALAALKELEFDHRTGKISDSDYRGALGPLRAEGAPRPDGAAGGDTCLSAAPAAGRCPKPAASVFSAAIRSASPAQLLPAAGSGYRAGCRHSPRSRSRQSPSRSER